MVYRGGNGQKLRVKMLTSAKIGKQNGDTRTRKPEPGYLNLSDAANHEQPPDLICRDYDRGKDLILFQIFGFKTD